MKPQRLPAVVLITGTPGTGKTSVSKLLADQIGAHYISLNRVARRERLHEAVDRARQTRVLDLDRTRLFFRKFLKDQKGTEIVDTHIADAVPKQYARRVIVLRCHPRVLDARLRRKGWGSSKVRENVLAEILDLCYSTAASYYGVRNVAQIDTSKLTPPDCVRKLRSMLSKQLSHRANVDWLGVIVREHDSEKYLG